MIQQLAFILTIMTLFQNGCRGSEILQTLDSPVKIVNKQFGDVAVASTGKIYIRANEENSQTDGRAQGRIYEYLISSGQIINTYYTTGTAWVKDTGPTSIGNVMALSDHWLLDCWMDGDHQRRAAIHKLGSSEIITYLEPDPAGYKYIEYSSGAILEDVGLIIVGVAGLNSSSFAGNSVYAFSLSTGKYLRTITSPSDTWKFGQWMEYEDGKLLIADQSDFYLFDQSGTLMRKIELDQRYANLNFTEGEAYGAGKLALPSSEYKDGKSTHTIRVYDVDSQTSVPYLIIPAPDDLIDSNDVDPGSSWGLASLAISDGILAVGAYDAPVMGTSLSFMAGRVYFYRLSDGQRIGRLDNPEVAINPITASLGRFGQNISAASGYFLVGEQTVSSSSPNLKGRNYLLAPLSRNSDISQWTLY